MRSCSRWNFADRLQETSNCYCGPGMAGESSAYARLPLLPTLFELKATEKAIFCSSEVAHRSV